MKLSPILPALLSFVLINVVRADPVTLSSSSDSATCFNSQDGSIMVNVLTGTGNYNYYLSKGNYYFFPGYVHVASALNQGSATYTFNNLDTGHYYILVTDIHNDIGQATQDIYEPPELSGGIITVMKALTCNDGNDAVLRANPTGGIPPYSYTWFYDDPPPPTNYTNTGVTTRDYTTAGQGKYYCRIDDANNCGPKSSVTLTFAYLAHDSVPAPLSVSASATPSCEGQDNGSVSISGSGGWTPYQYHIINSSSDMTGPQPGGVFSNLPPDTYEPWITDDKGCAKKGTDVTVATSPLPSVDAGSNITRCDATPLAPVAMTGASASGTYSAATWTGGAGLGTWSQNINPALATFTPSTPSGSFTATITLTGSGACSGTNPADTRTITWGQTPTADAGSNITRCDATPLAPIEMTGASASGTYISATWTGGAGLGTWTQNADPELATFTPTTTSGSFTATLTLTGSGACAGTNPADTRTITWGQMPIVDAGSNISRCDGTPLAPLTMTGATATGSYSAATWTGGAGLGTWSQNANPALATFTPTTTSGSFTATLTLTGSGGCAGTNPSDTRTITWGQTPAVDAGSNITRCDATPLAPITMTGATATGTYSAATWTGGAGLGTWSQNANPALATFTPTTASGSFTATITLTGSGACSGTDPADTRTITWGQTPTVNAGSNITRCDATPLAPIAMTGATATGTYTSATWTGGAGLGTWTQNANPALATFTPTTTSGSFTATITLTGSGACSGTNPSDTRTITWGQTPTVDAGSSITRCDATPLAPIAMTGASASGTYSAATWTGGAGLGTWTQNANPALATFTPTTTSGSFTATITITGSGGCTGTNPSDTRTITWGETPTVDAGSNITRCDATPLAPVAMTGATASGSYSAATWTGGAGLGTWTQNTNPALATFTPTTTSGSFTATITLTGSGGCTGTNPADTRTISWGETPTVDAGGNISRCDATPIAPIAMAGASASGTYTSATWTGGAGLGTWTQNANPALATFTPTTTSGSFTATITLTGSGGCTGTNPADTRTISWGQTPTVDAGSNIIRCDATPLAPIAMTGASASGTYTSATWTGGAGLGTWTQNANPALATFTPTTTSGSFTATITVTGGGACSGTDPSDTRTISWGQTPAVDAGSNIIRCDATPLAPVAMTGATATGSYSAATWTGGAGLGTWTQDANPALATFTPTTTSGSFTATITLTGSGGCTGTNPTDTRTISWGETPAVDAGGNIDRCDATPLAPIAMTGASATGSFSAATWTGGAGLGTWSQNANPALATFTPTTTTGSFTANITLTGSGGCTGTDPSDTRTISWGETPAVDAGADIDRCDATPLAPVAMTGTTATGSYSAATWTGGAGLGIWTQNANPALATFTPTTTSGSFTATITLTGSGACSGTDPSDTRTITWGQTPAVDAGSNITRCDATPLAPVAMTGATATGTYTSATWTGGAGLGTWTQDANPALATFTPTATSGSFTATITLTGSGACSGTNPSDTRTITWGQTPTVDAGTDIDRCDMNPTAPVSMTGAVAAGTFSDAVWTGGEAFGTWTQNSDPALAVFTPSTNSGSITATLTLTGTGACAGEDPAGSRVITWNKAPEADAGDDMTICYGSDIQLAGTLSDYNTFFWDRGAGDGFFDDEFIEDPVYYPGPNDLLTGSVKLYLTATGNGTCSDVTDSVTITIPPQLIATIGAPTPFLIGPNTIINVSVMVEGKEAIEDLSYYLQAPDGTRIPLKIANNFFMCNWADEADITFTNDPSVTDTLDICSIPPIPGIPLSGTFRTNADFSPLYGKDPANGAWSVLLLDCDYNIINPTDGALTNAGISFTDISYQGYPETVAYESGAINTPISQSPVGACGETSYISPIGLFTRCFNTCDALALVTVVGGTPPYLEYNWSPAPFAGNMLDSVYLCKGSYSLEVVDALGCTSIAAVEVYSPPEMEFVSFEYTDSLNCGNTDDGIIACRVTGGTGVLNYTLQPGDVPSAAADSGRFADLPGGTYTVRIEDINGCYIDTTINIFQPDVMRLDSVSIDSILCSGDTNGSIRVYASGGTQPYTFWISPGTEVNSDGIFDNLGEGDYTVSFTDTNRCDTIYTSLISLQSPEQLLITMITVEHAVCHDSTGSIRLFVSGGSGPYETSVNGGGLFVPGLEVQGLIPGIYDVVVMDKNLCTDTYTTPVEVINPPVMVIDSFSVTDITGCYGDSTGSLYVRADGGWGRFEYGLDEGPMSASSQFDNITGGNHVLYISDSLGCTLTIDTIDIDQPPRLVVQEIVGPAVTEHTGSITLLASGGTPPYQYSIDNGLNLQDTNYFGNLDAGIYDAYVTDSHGCTYTDTVNVSARLLLVEILDYKDASCYGFSDGGFTVLILNGAQPYNVLITDTLTGEIMRDVSGYNQDIFADENFEAGSYSIRIIDTQGQVFDSVFVIDQPTQIIPVVTKVNASCEEFSNDGSIEVTASGGAGNYTYQWSDDVTATGNVRTSLLAGSYYLTVTDESGCPVTTEIIVGFGQEAVLAYAGEDTTICAYTPYQLQGLASDPDSIRWSFDPDDLVSGADESVYISNSANLTSDMATNRMVSLLLRTYKNGCYGLDTVTIDVYPVYDLVLYEYDEPPVNMLDSLIYLSEGETYPFWALLSDGLTQFPASNYLWEPSSGLQVDAGGSGTITQAGDSVTYLISGISSYGCPNTAILKIILLKAVKIYSGFTPNEDGYNDKWIIENAEGYGPRIKVRIFNRWGELVFDSVGYDGDKAWDGTFKGKPLPIGTYYYIIDIDDGKTNPITGAVTLIR